ncbi:MAG: secreted protein [Myxococcaceae bacterium]|nr:secreted protein [Myxococcaceae bacterium]
MRVRWLGTAGHVIETATATLLIDPFVTRPSLLSTATKRLVPDEDAIGRHVPNRVDAVICGHSHYDHLLDAPRIAVRTGAKIIGSASTCSFARAAGVAEDKLVAIAPEGGVAVVGNVEIRFVPSKHGRIAFGRVPFPGEVPVPPQLPARLHHYKMGGAYGILVKDRTSGVSIYHNGSADLVDVALDGLSADVLLVGLAGRQGTKDYVERLVRLLAPSVVVPTHHDAFFAPLERGVHLLPRIDLEGFFDQVRILTPNATRIAPDYGEELVVPAADSRGAFLQRA